MGSARGYPRGMDPLPPETSAAVPSTTNPAEARFVSRMTREELVPGLVLSLFIAVLIGAPMWFVARAVLHAHVDLAGAFITDAERPSIVWLIVTTTIATLTTFPLVRSLWSLVVAPALVRG